MAVREGCGGRECELIALSIGTLLAVARSHARRVPKDGHSKSVPFLGVPRCMLPMTGRCPSSLSWLLEVEPSSVAQSHSALAGEFLSAPEAGLLECSSRCDCFESLARLQVKYRTR